MDRKVGIEIEFAGLSLEDSAAALVTDESRLHHRTDHVLDLDIDGFENPFRLEVDFDLLKRLSREEADADQPDALRRLAIDVLDLAASVLVPLELVSPPVAIEDLARVRDLLGRLEKAGAVGTQDSVAYAFGVHFNPDLPEPGPACLLRHLQAFMLLYPALRDREALDLTRQVTTYVDPFPRRYEALVLADGYAPDLEDFTADYLAHNPTRNRALDLLPALADMGQGDLIQATLEDERIQARPTFHYRLPNSRLGDPDWSILDPWARWCAVEALAEDQDTRRELAGLRLESLDSLPLSDTTRRWKEAAAAWLDGH